MSVFHFDLLICIEWEWKSSIKKYIITREFNLEFEVHNHYVCNKKWYEKKWS